MSPPSELLRAVYGAKLLGVKHLAILMKPCVPKLLATELVDGHRKRLLRHEWESTNFARQCLSWLPTAIESSVSVLHMESSMFLSASCRLSFAEWCPHRGQRTRWGSMRSVTIGSLGRVRTCVFLRFGRSRASIASLTEHCHVHPQTIGLTLVHIVRLRAWPADDDEKQESRLFKSKSGG